MDIYYEDNDNLNRASGAHDTLLSKRGMAAKAAAFLCIFAAMVTVCLVLLAASGSQAFAAETEEVVLGDTTASEEINTDGEFSVITDDDVTVLDWTAVYEVAELINALPNPYEASVMSNEEQLEVYYALMEADDAYQALSEEQQARIDDSNLDALYEYFSGSLSLTAAEAGGGDTGGSVSYTFGTFEKFFLADFVDADNFSSEHAQTNNSFRPWRK